MSEFDVLVVIFVTPIAFLDCHSATSFYQHLLFGLMWSICIFRVGFPQCNSFGWSFCKNMVDYSDLLSYCYEPYALNHRGKCSCNYWPLMQVLVTQQLFAFPLLSFLLHFQKNLNAIDWYKSSLEQYFRENLCTSTNSTAVLVAAASVTYWSSGELFYTLSAQSVDQPFSSVQEADPLQIL